MELEKGKITILTSEDKVTIEIKDDQSARMFCRVELTPEQFCEALSRLMNTSCKKVEVFNLDKVGKKMEMDTLVFEIDYVNYRDRRNTAIEKAKKECPEGWEPDEFYGSKDSFFERDGKNMARTTIRRWV